MIRFNEQTAVAFNTDDLSEALTTDNSISYVYLGDDITLAYGVEINPVKPRLVIDGLYGGTIHTLTDMASTVQTQTIHVRQESSMDLVFKNMNIVGRNYFGTPSIFEGAEFNNIKLTYDNVVYTGPQITFNPNGLTRYIDCFITIIQNHSPAQGVGEVCKVEIGGVTVIQKNVTEHSVFWFRGANQDTPYFKILAGSDVIISTLSHFMYSTYPVPYTIEEGANLTLYT